MNMRAHTNGFTLIEMIIYVALLGILLGGALTAAISLSDGGERNVRALQMRQEATFIEDKIGWVLTNATSVSNPNKGSELVVYRMAGDDFDASENPITVYLADDTLMMRRASGAPHALNAEGFPISAFSIGITESDFLQIVRVQFEMNGETFTTSYSRKL